MTEDWQKVLDLQKAGDVVEGTIKALNRSALCCDNLPAPSLSDSQACQCMQQRTYCGCCAFSCTQSTRENPACGRIGFHHVPWVMAPNTARIVLLG